MVYLFIKPCPYDKDQAVAIEELFDKLNSEIEDVFESKPIRRFCKKNNIELFAFAAKSSLMQSLYWFNINQLY